MVLILDPWGMEQIYHRSRFLEIPSELHDRLTEVYHKFSECTEDDVALPDIPTWLRSPIPDFDGETPMSLLERGEVERVMRAAEVLVAGEPI
jgi:hypothetical protein